MDLEPRMKVYESSYRQKLVPLLPVIVRLDGRAFHTKTRDLIKPFDEQLHFWMRHVTQELVQETNARVGYTQSDEISLLLYSHVYDSQIYFDGNVNKINSICAGLATQHFNFDLIASRSIAKIMGDCVFDCRCFNLPVEEVANYFVWREQDAIRNSIEAAAQANFSHHSLHGRNQKQMQERLWQEKGINWNDYPYFQKRGSYIRQVKTKEKFTVEELESLPPKHDARKNPDLVVERNRIIAGEVPVLTTIANRTEFLLYGEQPIRNTV